MLQGLFNFRNRSSQQSRGKIELSMAEFYELFAQVDANKDGLISIKELSEALRKLGFHLTMPKAWFMMQYIDLNGNNLIDSDKEMKKLIKFLREYCGIIIRKK